MSFRNNKIHIISGGQSGVERAALDFALSNGLLCSGWCNQGRIADDGKIPLRYPLNEALSKDVIPRILQNIYQCDGLLIIIGDEMDMNSQLTYNLANDCQKPVFLWSLSGNNNYRMIRKWIDEISIGNIYITGDSEHVTKGIHEETLELMGKIFPEYLA